MTDTASVDMFLARTLLTLRDGERSTWSLGEETSWRNVWLRVEYHGIAMLLHKEANALHGWPTALIERVAEESRLIALWEETHRNLVGRIVETLAENSIESITLKGTALAYSLHADPATRRRGDTDLLVRAEAVDRTRQILKDHGWQKRDDPHGLYFQEGWTHEAAGFFVHSIDLHWRPVDRPSLHNVLPLEELYKDKVALPRFSRNAFRPSVPWMMLHAVINQKWHSEHGYFAEDGRLASPRRLIWSIDFELMSSAMTNEDWDTLADHCIAEGIAPLVVEALDGMKKDLGVSPPRTILMKMSTGKLAPKLVAAFREQDSLTQFAADIRHTTGVLAKARLFISRLFPPRKHLMKKYPHAQRWPTVMLQGRMLCDTAMRLIRHGQSR